jgi:hypothetical protein
VREANCQIPALASQALAMKADAVAVWGSPADPRYPELLEDIRRDTEMPSSHPFDDPYRGEVGTIFLFDTKK